MYICICKYTCIYIYIYVDLETAEAHSDLAQVAVQLSREAQAAGHAAHSRGDQMVQVAVRGRRQLQGPEADVLVGVSKNQGS